MIYCTYLKCAFYGVDVENHCKMRVMHKAHAVLVASLIEARMLIGCVYL